MNSSRYVPILKAREAEVLALRRRPPSLEVTPYFELQAESMMSTDPATGLPRRTKSAVTDASYFFDDIARLWDGTFYLDVSRVAPVADRERWWDLIVAVNALNPTPKSFIPALAEGDLPDTWAAVAMLARNAGRAAMRVRLPHPDPSTLPTTLATAADELGLPLASIDVVLDWADQMEADVISLDDLQKHTIAVIGALGSAHGDVITTGTPNSKTFVQAGYWTPRRREWQLWLRLTEAGSDVVYGDYSLYPPSDPGGGTPSYGHLRYSVDDVVHVHRSARPATGGGLRAAFAQCCVDVVGGGHFLGSSFSSADSEIEEIAAGVLEMGSAKQWRLLGAVHHLHVVDGQLTSLPPAPVAGTP
jgi:hypothetical protein